MTYKLGRTGSPGSYKLLRKLVGGVYKLMRGCCCPAVVCTHCGDCCFGDQTTATITLPHLSAANRTSGMDDVATALESLYNGLRTGLALSIDGGGENAYQPDPYDCPSTWPNASALGSVTPVDLPVTVGGVPHHYVGMLYVGVWRCCNSNEWHGVIDCWAGQDDNAGIGAGFYTKFTITTANCCGGSGATLQDNFRGTFDGLASVALALVNNKCCHRNSDDSCQPQATDQCADGGTGVCLESP